MNKKIKLGKVLKNIHGFRIRLMLENVTTDTISRTGAPSKTTKLLPGNNIGLYNGKHLLQTYQRVDISKAINDAQGIYEKRYHKRDLIHKIKNKK